MLGRLLEPMRKFVTEWYSSPLGRPFLILLLILLAFSFAKVADVVVFRIGMIDPIPGLLFIFALPFIWSFLRKTNEERHSAVQLLILMITVVSLYAFGWPEDLSFEHLRHAVTELCVILLLFFLAELASYLTLASEAISSDIKNTAETVVSRLSGVSQMVAAVATLTEPATTQQVVTGVSSYAKAWAEFLEGVWSNPDQDRALRLESSRRFFQIYLEDERDGISYKVAGRQRVRVTTRDILYFKILNGLLQMHRDAHSTAPNKAFAWGITNVPPVDFYHWGQEYGHLGPHAGMDEFRNTVKKLATVSEYERLFLVYDGAAKGSAIEKQIGIDIKHIDAVHAWNKDLLLLVSRKKDADPADDEPMSVQDWTEIRAWKYILRRLADPLPEESVTPSSDDKFYGIFKADDLSALKTDMGVELSDVTIGGVRPNDTRNEEYSAKVVKLLDHFGTVYQSSHQLSFLTVHNKSTLDGLFETPDCLILGTKRANKYYPVIAIGTHVDLAASTMQMEIFTDPADLQDLKAFWVRNSPNRKSIADILALSRNGREEPETGSRD